MSHLNGDALQSVLGWRDAIASVSMSHPQTCRCDVCLAAAGDEEAFARVLLEFDDDD